MPAFTSIHTSWGKGKLQRYFCGCVRRGRRVSHMASQTKPDRPIPTMGTTSQYVSKFIQPRKDILRESNEVATKYNP
jgi:hypothetical protein